MEERSSIPNGIHCVIVSNALRNYTKTAAFVTKKEIDTIVALKVQAFFDISKSFGSSLADIASSDAENFLTNGAEKYHIFAEQKAWTLCFVVKF